MTSGRTSIAAGAVAAAGATVAVFAGANMIGHTLGYDLWPMFDGNGARVIEVPAASPNGPGVNPLLPTASSPLTRTAQGSSTATGTVAFGPGAVPLPAASVQVPLLPGARVSGSASPADRPQRRGSRGSSGNNGSGSTTTRPSTPQPSAPSTPVQSAPSAPAATGNVNVSGRPSGSSADTSGSGSSSSGNSTTKSNGSSTKTTTAKPAAPAATPPSPGQAKKPDPAPAPAAPSNTGRDTGDAAAPAAAGPPTGTPGSSEAPPAPGQGKGGN